MDAPYCVDTVIGLHGYEVACGKAAISLTRLCACTVIGLHGYCVATVMRLYGLQNKVILLKQGYASHSCLYKRL